MDVKAYGSTVELHPKLSVLSLGEVSGISCVGVKSVEITRNTESEGNSLEQY